MKDWKPLAIITGAGSGIGQTIATDMAEHYDAILCDLDEGRVSAFTGRCETCAGDLSQSETIDRLIGMIGAREVAAFVHAAGISPTMAGPAEILRVNLLATLALCDAIGPLMAKGGAAVLFASIGAHVLPDPTILEKIEAVVTAAPEDRGAALEAVAAASPDSGIGYGASKRGVMMIARKRAVEWGRRGARIVSISPGIIETPMGRQELDAVPVMTPMIQASAMGRMGRPEEIAAAVRFLTSEAASFVTGIDLVVDGGTLAGIGVPA